MKQLKAFKFQLKTNDAQAKQLRRFAGCCRLVWNKGLALQKERLDEKQGILSYPKMAAELIKWKYAPETVFLREAPSQALQQTLKNLDRALRDAFDKKSPKRFPLFKKKSAGDAPPSLLIFKLPPELAPALVQDGFIQPRFGLYVLAGPFRRAFGSS